jgi:hypothetical protein
MLLLPEPGAFTTPAVAVTPVGAPVTLTVTAALKLFTPAIVAALLPLAPGATLSEAGFSVSEKLGGGSTVRESEAVLVTPPPVALTVNG